MQKKIIALAIAGALAAPLAAQADVKISGLLQSEIVSLSGDGANEGLYIMDGQEGGAQDAGNAGMINISVSEDLGGGLTAVAKKGINASTDRGLGDRDGYVGLSGGFGTVLIGTMNSPYKSSTVKWDPFLTTAAQARGNVGMSGLHNGYVGNAVAYANNFGGVKLVAGLVLDEAPDGTGSTTGNHAMSIAVNAPVGPVEVALAMHDQSEIGGSAADQSATKIGVKWSQDNMGVAFQYEMLDAGLGDMNIMYVNFTMGMGNGNTLAVAYGSNDQDNVNGTYMALGMVHSFSKNVSGHVGYIGVDSDVAGTDVSGIAAGLRVKF